MKTPWVSRGPSSPTVTLLLLVAALCVDAYKPVIIVHGVFSGPEALATLKNFITKAHPGTEVKVISLFNYGWSLIPLWIQIEGFKKAIAPIMEKADEGVHLLCYSQGGVICRGLLSTFDDHNVHSFIALASPLAGQFGNTEYLKPVFPGCVKKEVFSLCYNDLGQLVSICNYWKDPHQKASYLQGNKFLPLLDGEIHHKNRKSWRKNFLRIKRLVLIGGPNDGVITPWQSSQFGFYDRNEKIVEMRNQKFYKRDTFGLKTLDRHGRISVCTQSGVKHVKWHSNRRVFKRCIEKWLT